MTHDEYEDLRADITELKQDMKEMRSKIDCLFVSGYPPTLRQINDHDTVIKDHESRIRTLEQFAPFIKVMMAAAGILGVSIAALIWSLIVGQANIIFP